MIAPGQRTGGLGVGQVDGDDAVEEARLPSFEHHPFVMAQLAEKRIAPAQQMLETVDAGPLEALDKEVRGAVSVGPAEIAVLEERQAEGKQGGIKLPVR